MKSIRTIAALAAGAAILVWWFASSPPSYIEVAPPYLELLPDGPPELARWKQADRDFVAQKVETLPSDLPGHDEVVILPERKQALVTAMDGWIWLVDLVTGKAGRFVDPPLNAAGALRDPTHPNRVFFCAARLYGQKYSPTEHSGVYSLDLNTKAILPVVLRVPLPPERVPPRTGQNGSVFVGNEVAASSLTEVNSRRVQFCNDLDVSRDGQRIYFSEPFAYQNASMGGGAFREAISLGRNGRLWMADISKRTVRLVAQNYTFIDGVLLEYPDAKSKVESAVLVSETVKFRLLRFHISGERAGQDQLLWHSLPGLPDGLDRDARGRVWVGLVKDRSRVVTYVHRHPWLKPLLLRLPHWLLPVPKRTGIMALSADASRVLFYSMHAGSKLTDISVVVPGADHLYLPVFREGQRGLHRIPFPVLSE